jgi:hypothetical protein
MTLAKLAALLSRYALQILNLLGIISGAIAAAAIEHLPYQIETTVTSTSLNVASPAFGLAAIKTQTQAIYDQLLATSLALATLSDGLLSPGGGVILPNPPPAGYGGGDLSSLPGEVWAFHWDGSGTAIGAQLYQGAFAAFNNSVVNADITAARYFVPVYWATGVPTFSGIHEPTFDPGSYLAGENLLDALIRQNPTATCNWWDGVGGHVFIDTGVVGSIRSWVTRFDDYQWAAERPQAVIPIPQLTLPTWPGLLSVVLGTPVPLDLAVTVPGPLDGVLIDITSVPTKQGYFQFDSIKAWRNVGAVTFASDNGDVELAQTLAFEHAVYCPRTIVRAASANLRCSPGVIGTCTPWVRI